MCRPVQVQDSYYSEFWCLSFYKLLLDGSIYESALLVDWSYISVLTHTYNNSALFWVWITPSPISTVWCPYNKVSFPQLPTTDTPYLAREGKVWGACCDLKIRYIFYRCNAHIVCNVQYCIKNDHATMKTFSKLNINPRVTLLILLTGLKTSILQSRWTASCVACPDSVYNAAMDGARGLWLNTCDLAASHAVFMSSNVGVPSNSTIRSSCKHTKWQVILGYAWIICSLISHRSSF